MGRNGLAMPTIAGYMGAKTRLVPALIELIAKAKDTTTYGELFGGMGSTLLNKPSHPKEIYNDLSVENYSIFKCFADPDLSDAFIDRILQSDYSEETYNYYRQQYESKFRDKIGECVNALAKGPLPNDLKDWRDDNLLELGVTSLILTKLSPRGMMSSKSFAGYYSGLEGQGYDNWKLNLYSYADRLRNVDIRNQDALDIIQQYSEDPNAIFLCDSPYYGEHANCGSEIYNAGAILNAENKTEGNSKYSSEAAFQKAYMQLIQSAKCKIIVCGYDNDLYPQYLTPECGWTKQPMGELAKSAKNNGLGEMRDRVEEWVWVNYDIL